MRKTKLSYIGKSCILGLLLTACSAQSGGTASSDAAQTAENASAGSTAVETTMTEEVSAEEETTTAEETTAPKEQTTLTVYSFRSEYSGMQDGWYGDILEQELGLKVNVQTRAGLESADIIVWPFASDAFYEWVEDGRLLVWDDALLDTCGQTIRTYLSDNLDGAAGLTDGVLYGFTGNAGKRGITEDGEEYPVEYLPDGNPVFTINAASGHPEEAMRFLDWMASAEGMLTYWYGPEKVCWDMDEEGYYFLTEFGKKCLKREDPEMPDGKTFSEGVPTLDDVPWHLQAYIYDSGHGQSYDARNWERERQKEQEAS